MLSEVDALLYPSFRLEDYGSIAAILAAAPELCVRLQNTVDSGDHPGARALQEKLLGLRDAIAGPNLPGDVKTALSLKGRPAGAPHLPIAPGSAQQVAAIRAALVRAGLLLT